MPGMNNGLNISDPTVVAAFRAALLHQGMIALLIFAVLGLAWVSLRESRPASASTPPEPTAEPVGRLVLRSGFGLLWIASGILLAQPGMPVGLPAQVIQPAAASSPPWVQHLVNWAGTHWSYHPIQLAAGAVWIEIGIGVWLLTARRGRLSQIAGLASFGWGLVVWVFGEAFGGIFAPGLSWLTGAPGPAALYCVGGLLVALPAAWWCSPRLGRLLLAGMGVFLAGMAVLQAWPGRGYWQGAQDGRPGPLTTAVAVKAYQQQPNAIAYLVSGFSHVARNHGFAVNLVVVVALALFAVAFVWARPQVVLPTVGVMSAFCAAVWLQIQDLGFLGGLGTDLGSMVPIALLAIVGYLALARAPGPEPGSVAAEVPATGAAAADASVDETPQEDPSAPVGQHRGWRALPGLLAAVSIRTVTAVAAIGVILLGAVPIAVAQASPGAAPILAQAVDGSTVPLDSPAPAFTLTDQHGRRVSLASLHGRAVLLTFLDPVCVTDCPLIAQEFRQAAQLLGYTRHVELVAVNLNPLYSGTSYIQAFDRSERLAGLPDWLYLTGSPAQLRPVWKHYGAASETLPAGAMLGHSDLAYAIDPRGHLFEELDFDPGPGTGATQSSFAAELAATARQALTR